MLHDPLDSLDAALMVIRDCARRVIDAQSKLRASPEIDVTLAAIGIDREQSELTLRYTVVSGQIERAWQEIDKARIAWKCHQSPAPGLIDAAGAALAAVRAHAGCTSAELAARAYPTHAEGVGSYDAWRVALARRLTDAERKGAVVATMRPGDELRWWPAGGAPEGEAIRGSEIAPKGDT